MSRLYVGTEATEKLRSGKQTTPSSLAATCDQMDDGILTQHLEVDRPKYLGILAEETVPVSNLYH
jgi:hypothetical protein